MEITFLLFPWTNSCYLIQYLTTFSEVSRLGLEDLKEATDEGEEIICVPPVEPQAKDNNTLPHSQRGKRVMRSLSDSHLLLRSSLRGSRRICNMEYPSNGSGSEDSTGSGWWDQQWLRLEDTRQVRTHSEGAKLGPGPKSYT